MSYLKRDVFGSKVRNMHSRDNSGHVENEKLWIHIHGRMQATSRGDATTYWCGVLRVIVGQLLEAGLEVEPS